MTKFLRNLAFVALLAATAFLGWRAYSLNQEIQTLRHTRLLLENEKRELEAKLAAAGTTPKPEEQTTSRELIEKQTSDLRGLTFKQPVNYKSIGRDELRKVLVQKMGEQFTKDELRDYGRTLETIGLIPEGTDLMETVVGLYDEQVAAFYVPEERTLYTFKDMTLSGNLDKVTLSHELTHALQDQNFDLTKFPLKVKDNDDLALATAALVEGDATLAMAQFYGEHLDVRNMLEDVMGGMLGQKTAKLQAAPAFFRDMLLFPYQEGTEFAMAIFADGGVEALNQAFRHPPVSTRQILHPERYLHNRHDPETIELPTFERAGWRLIGNNVLGEFGLRSLLGEHLGVFEAQRIAAGWNGDRYQVYEHGTDGPTSLLWKSAWESDAAATEFEQAYRRIAAKRELQAEVTREGNRVTIRQAKDAGALAEFVGGAPGSVVSGQR